MRQQDRLKALRAYVQQAARMPFRPGHHDCALFAAGAVAAMTGRDYAADLRGQYRTIEDGKALLQEQGFGDHVALAASLFAEIPPLMAQIGDLAVVEEDGEQALGVVQGACIYVLRLDGLGTRPLTAATKAFRV